MMKKQWGWVLLAMVSVECMSMQVFAEPTEGEDPDACAVSTGISDSKSKKPHTARTKSAIQDPSSRSPKTRSHSAQGGE